MNNIVRAWKDAAYRQSLSAEEQAIVPANPAGEIELTDAELQAIYGTDGGDNNGGENADKNKIGQTSVEYPTTNQYAPSSGGLNLLNGLHLNVLGSNACSTSNSQAANEG